ncbi:MAG: response regulator transcription factor [Acidimicrobiia bacterium]
MQGDRGAHDEAGSRVLVVEDDDGNRLLVRRYLELEGYTPLEATDGPSALRAVVEHDPAAIVLDLGLPGLDGLDVLTRIRRDSGVPVLVLTGRDGEPDLLRGFAAGADDYLAKPYSLPELGARLRALLRRGTIERGATRLAYGSLEIDLDAARVTRAGDPLDLRPKELALLSYLAAAPDRCFTREELLESVWGSTAEWQQPSTVTEHVHRIRQKLRGEDDHNWIETVRGLGYRFSPPPD